jgi:basic membrane protein A
MKRLLAAGIVPALVAVGAGSSVQAEGRLRVGLVLEDTAVNRASVFANGAFVGLQRAVKTLGVSGKVVAPNPKEPSNFVPSFSYFARQKYDLIIGLGFLEAPAEDAVALKFSAARFAIVDTRWEDLKHRPKNVLGTLFKTEQAGYLAGYLAGLMERRRPGRDVVSTVGGFKIPTVDAYIAGFQAGAKASDPRIATLNAYAQDFVNPDKCRTLALDQIAHGSGAVFGVAGPCGLGALEAAKENGVWGIGVDIDQSYLGPHILTSVTKRLDVAVFDIVRSLQEGKFKPGRDVVFDLRNGGVGLGRISPKVPPGLLAEVAKVRSEIVAGRINVPSTIEKP